MEMYRWKVKPLAVRTSEIREAPLYDREWADVAQRQRVMLVRPRKSNERRDLPLPLSLPPARIYTPQWVDLCIQLKPVIEPYHRNVTRTEITSSRAGTSPRRWTFRCRDYALRVLQDTKAREPKPRKSIAEQN